MWMRSSCWWAGLLLLCTAMTADTTDFNPDDNLSRSGFETSTCSNTVVEDAEQCDDGNLDPLDGCAMDCRIEPGFACAGSPSVCTTLDQFEVEPNDTISTANAGFTTSGSVLGGISPIGDLDYFRVQMAQSFKVVRFESFAPIEGDCLGGVTTTLHLRHDNGTQIVADSASGISACAAIALGMAPATYYIQIEETGNNAVVAGYALLARFLSDQGAELEFPGMIGLNDNAFIAEVSLLGAHDGVVFGDHSVDTDADYYQISVPAGAGIRAEIIEGDREVATCESNTFDPLLRLHGADGTTQLATDDDSARGFCSLIDGTGSAPMNAGARNTSGVAQTWFLAARASIPSGSGSSFTYRLAVTIR
jgi:cysteine-rich repeat protein